MIKSYRDLDVWKMGIELVERVYQITDDFPNKEQYRLTKQLCTAAVSVPSNVAEGSKRHTTRDFIRFLGISMGSLAEVETQLIIAHRLKYITENVLEEMLALAGTLGRKLHALSNALEEKIANNSPTPTLTLTPEP